MIGGYLGRRPTLAFGTLYLHVGGSRGMPPPPPPREILKIHTLGDAFSLILGAKSRAFRTDFYQVTSTKVTMNWSVDCFHCLILS